MPSALTMTVLRGPVETPLGEQPSNGRLFLALRKADREGTTTIAPQIIRIDLDAAGNFEQAVWATQTGAAGQSYAAWVEWWSHDDSRARSETLGYVSVPDSDTALLANLWTADAPDFLPGDILAQCLAAAGAATGSATAARSDRIAAQQARADAIAVAASIVDQDLVEASVVGNGVITGLSFPGVWTQKKNFVDVMVGGVKQHPDSYTISNNGTTTTLSFGEPIPTGVVATGKVTKKLVTPIVSTVAALEVGTRVTAGFGTAAEPAYSYTGDGDTGMYRAAANQLGFATGGVQRALMTTTAWTIDVLLSGSAITQSRQDTTANRVMKVGDNGLPYAIPLTAADNLDNIPTSGLYFNGTGGNTPGNNYPVASAGSLLHITDGNAGRGTQTFIAYQTGRSYKRSKGSGGVWSSWSTDYGQNSIIGAVSQLAGVPTGALIQSNSNGNGRSERLASGSQRVLKIDFSVTAITTAVGSRFRSVDYTWTFPVGFFAGEIPHVDFTAIDPDCDVRMVSVSATAAVFQVRSDVSKAGPVVVTASAEGRWSDMV